MVTNTTTIRLLITMASVTTDYVLSTPLTDDLKVLLELQRIDDFASVSTSRSTISLSRTNIDKID